MEPHLISSGAAAWAVQGDKRHPSAARDPSLASLPDGAHWTVDCGSSDHFWRVCPASESGSKEKLGCSPISFPQDLIICGSVHNGF